MKSQYSFFNKAKNYFKVFKHKLSKPQFNHFSSLILGNLHGLGEIRKIADLYSDKDQSSLSRFLLSNAWNHEEINDTRISHAKEIGNQRYKKYCSVIIDDTVTQKYGKELPGVGFYFSHAEGRVIWGQNVISSHLLVGDLDLPLFADLYLKENQITNNTPEFRSKIDIAIEHIEKFPRIQNKEVVVISDSWFPSEEYLKTTIRNGFTALSAIKSNRKVLGDCGYEQVCDIRINIDFSPVKVKGIHYRYIMIKTKLQTGKISVNLIISQRYNRKKREWEAKKYLISTNTNMRASEMLYLYSERWKIETFYQIVKKELGFKINRNTSYLSCLRLIYIIFMSYTFLMLQSCKLSIYFEGCKTIYQQKEDFKKEYLWSIILWSILKALNGMSLIDIRLKLRL